MRLGSLICLLPVATRAVVAMDMDSDMDMMDEGYSEASTTIGATRMPSTPSAVPYEPKHVHGLPILSRPNLTPSERLYWTNYNTTTYFATDFGNRAAFKYHVVSMALVVVILYPISLALNSVGSNWYLPVLTLNLGFVLSSLLTLSIFGATFPEDWYPHNAYSKVSWIFLVLIILHYVSALVSKASKWIADFSPLSSEFFPLHDYRSSLDDERAGNFTPATGNEDSASDSPSHSLTGNHASQKLSYELDREQLFDPDNMSLRFKSKSSQKRDSYLQKVFGNPLIQNIASRFGNLFSIIFNMLNYPLFVFMLVDVGIGVAVGNLLGKGSRIFNLLAHWIKGGVFFLLGILSLSRYCGFGKKHGWAWNKILITNSDLKSNYKGGLSRIFLPRGTITMEFMESFLIFFYGTTNVFLEHLAGAGGEWTAKDLQHVSIAFMYIGSGLCGLLAEMKLNDWRFSHACQHSENMSSNEIYAGSPGYSPNPFPAFTIFWTGILMSQHAQASQTSTSIHVQWGSLLSYGSFFRLLTFALLFVVPNKNFKPSKPFTELITSFCLLCGGLVFMESTDQVIEAMDYRGFTPMFSFNISVGFITLLMAWEMSLFLWKYWLEDRYVKSTQ